MTETATTAVTEEIPKLSPKERRLANLKPAWKKGQAVNPGGRRKDGKANVRQVLGGQHYRDALNALLAQPGKLDELARAMLNLAIEGNASAIAHIFQRLDPIKLDENRSPLILSGIKLELGPEGATITMGQTQAPMENDLRTLDATRLDRREIEDQGVPGGGYSGEISPPGSSSQISMGTGDTTTTT